MTKSNVVALSGLLLVLLSTGVLIASAQGGPAIDWWVIAGGGAPASGGSVTLNDTLGQPVIGAASGGSVTLQDGYWPGAGLAAPLAVTDLSASRAGVPPPKDCQLDWSPFAGAGVTYNIYRATNQPYFTPVTPIAEGLTSPTFTDAGALGDTSQAFYYVERTFQGGAASPSSNRVGTFSFTLVPGVP